MGAYSLLDPAVGPRNTGEDSWQVCATEAPADDTNLNVFLGCVAFDNEGPSTVTLTGILVSSLGAHHALVNPSAVRVVVRLRLLTLAVTDDVKVDLHQILRQVLPRVRWVRVTPAHHCHRRPRRRNVVVAVYPKKRDTLVGRTLELDQCHVKLVRLRAVAGVLVFSLHRNALSGTDAIASNADIVRSPQTVRCSQDEVSTD